jgi:SAM-dependent methyltransferase
VLDLCCGTGASALPAATATGSAGRVVAVDLAEELIRLGRQKASALGLRNIEFRLADLLTLDLEPESFDAVVCVFGIFFIPDMTAALRKMWSLVKPQGTLAVTVWGSGVFEPVNSIFWDAVRRIRPELFKSFNPWDRVGEPDLLRQLFATAELSAPEIVFEPATHPLEQETDVIALLMGTGYRGAIEQLTADQREQLLREVLDAVRATQATAVRVDVIYSTCRQPSHP